MRTVQLSVVALLALSKEVKVKQAFSSMIEFAVRLVVNEKRGNGEREALGPVTLAKLLGLSPSSPSNTLCETDKLTVCLVVHLCCIC